MYLAPSILFTVQRDPRKRRVKPVQKHLLQLDFGGLDSSDDSDFEVAEHAAGNILSKEM